ncbi:MAG: holo-ACP synthase [Bacillota bacterium]
MIIGHGIDIVKVKRINSVLNNYPIKFKKRVFTPEEIKYCDNSSQPNESYAVRFAAKEAVYKILCSELTWLDWQEISVRSEPWPVLTLLGKTKAAANKLGVINWHLSFSHEREYAIASIIAEGGGRDARPER